MPIEQHADVDTRLADIAAARFAGRFGLATGTGDKATRPLSEEELVAVRTAVAKRLAD